MTIPPRRVLPSWYEGDSQGVKLLYLGKPSAPPPTVITQPVV
jgi:hypothetical protein